MNKLFLAGTLAIVMLAAILAAGCTSNTPPTNTSPSPSPSSSSIPTSVNGHDYTYYHNLNDRSTCGLCHTNM